MSENQEAILILDAKAILAEGALWHPQEQVLYWVDIEGKKLHLYDPERKRDRQFAVGARIGTVVPVQGGGALVALQNGIYFIDTETGKLTLIENPLQQEDIRFNDGKCGPDGRFWVGTMALDKRAGAAALYCMETDGSIKMVLGNLTISNGIAWSADHKTMYLADTPTQQIFAFDFDAVKAEISNKRTLVEIPEAEGSPDGMTLDAEGNLWVALFRGGAVACYNPAFGKMIRKIKVPAPLVTSCAFGGEELSILYITTARHGLSEAQLKAYPGSGGIFSVIPGVKGISANYFTPDPNVSNSFNQRLNHF